MTLHRLRKTLLAPKLLILVFAGVSLLTVTVLSIQPILHTSELAQLQLNAVKRLSVVHDSLNASVAQYQFLPEILAQDPRIVASVTENQNDATSALLERLQFKSDAEDIFIMNTDGTAIASSNHTSAYSFVGKNYHFRPYFKSAINCSNGLYFAVGATSGVAGLFLSAPIYENTKIVGVVVVKISLATLEKSWTDAGEKFWLTDELGIIFLAFDPQWHYHTTQELSQESQQLIEQTKQYGLRDIAKLPQGQSIDSFQTLMLAEQGEYIVFQQDVSELGWVISWLVPVEELFQAIAIKRALVISIVIVLFTLFLWQRERVRRARSQNTLTRIIEQREAHQRAVIESTDAGLINLNEHGEITFVNSQARNLFKLETDVQLNIRKLISPWAGDLTHEFTKSALGLRTDHSTFPVLVSLKRIQSNRVHEYVLTIHDVSELKQVQLELERNNEELERRVVARTGELQHAEKALNQSQRLASLGRMSSAIAHEINQPITALANYAASTEVLIERNQTDKALNNVERIKGLIDRLSYISRQLRMVSGKRNSGVKPIKVRPIIAYAEDVLKQRLTETKVMVTSDITEDDRVLGNSMMLEQIVVNLMNNAIDAVVDIDQPLINITRERLENSLAIHISDNGKGLSEQEMEHLFEPFYTTKTLKQGLGLGLAISYNLASDMNGMLSVSNAKNNHVELTGATFTITLPTATES